MSASNIEAIYPLTPMQEGMLVHRLTDPGSSAYFLRAVEDLEDAPDTDALKRACAEVIGRHGVLRTVFVWENREKPIQIVLKRVRLPWDELDWSGNLDSQPESLEAFLREDRRKPFDFSKQPPLRLTLIKRGQDRFTFVWSTHHILLDGWCQRLLLGELLTVYRAILRGDPQRPKQPRPFRDYVAWLRRQDPARSEAFWRRYLRGFAGPTRLPGGLRPRGERSEPLAQKACGLTLEPRVRDRLASFARERQITLSTLVLGAWGLLVGLFCGQRDVVVGMVVSGRPPSLPGAGDMIGLFINTLPVRMRLDARQAMGDWMVSLQAELVALRNHEHSALIDIQGWSEVPRGLPLFRIAFSYRLPGQSGSSRKGSHSGQSHEYRGDVSLARVADPVAFPLVLRTGDDAGEIEMVFDPFFVEEAFALHMARHLALILTAMAEDPNRPLGAFAEPGPRDRQVLECWNRTRSPYPADSHFHGLFEAFAQGMPDHSALYLDGRWVTYGTLDARAGRLAGTLAEHGLQPEDRVGVFSDSGIAWVMGILAVMKAGGCYVPLDAGYPLGRLTEVVTDAGIRLVLSGADGGPAVQLPGTRMIVADGGEPGVSVREIRPKRSVDTRNLAYMIFTSGSTGRPKGVALAHLGLCNLVRVQDRMFRLGPQRRIIQLAAAIYDASIFEIAMALGAGATLVLGRRHQFLPGPGLWELLRTHCISNLTVTPSALALLPDRALPHLKTLVSAGEACPVELAARWARFPNLEFFNCYGPTETTVWATAQAVTGREQRLTIGGPIANFQSHVLSRGLGRVPVGAPGMLAVSGPGLARGYHGRSARTALSFIPDPISREPGGRLYLTGDRARFLPEGMLDFLGRTDNQVKLHGIRVELGEIESILKSHNAVREAVVSADPQLRAFLVTSAAVGAEELRGYLKRKLPSALVPTDFMFLDRIPLNASDKVDYRALGAMQPDRAQTRVDDAGRPRDGLETEFAGLWAEVLGLEAVGIHDDFFALGGHSIKAIRLATEMGRRLDLERERSFAFLMENPTIAGFIRAARGLQDDPERIGEDPDLEKDVALAPEIKPTPRVGRRTREPERILLTGATGFIGGFLLDELLRQTEARIYCLVRAPDTARAESRIEANLSSYGLSPSLSRVRPIVGDLGKPFLGLAAEAFESLGRELDLIFHNGAWVHFLYPYSVLRPVNVLGTRELLRLACIGKTTPFHLVSSLSVFEPADHLGRTSIPEDDPLEQWRGLRGGYARTKWVAERLTMLARDRNLPTAIYRLGRITGHSISGVCHTGELTFRLIKSFVQLGAAPRADRLEIEMTPVDYLCRAILHLAVRGEGLGKAFHLFNPHSIRLSQLIGWMNERGYPVDTVPFAEWLRLVRESDGSEGENPLAAIVPFPGDAGEGGVSDPGSMGKPPPFADTNLRLGLKGSGIECPRVDGALLDRYFHFLTESGFLPAPQTAAAKCGRN